MKPSQLATFLMAAIKANMPVCIVGGPGTSKTSVVRQATFAADNDLVVSHPGLSDPTDYKGFPWIEKGKAEFVPFGEVRRLLDSKKPTVWFMDDLGQAPASVQAAAMPWLLERQVNGNRLPDHVTIFAATNRKTDRAGVSGVLEPVKSRFGAIVELEPDLMDWCKWAVESGFMPSEIIAYLRFQPDDLYQFVASADLVNCPVPRTWENAGRILNLKLPPDIEVEALTGAIGSGMATKLMGFLSMVRQLPNIDNILANPNGDAIPTQTGVLYAITTGLAARATEANFKSVARYAERLHDADHGEFAALLCRDTVRRTPKVMTTPTYVKLMSGPLGQLIGGGVQ